MAALLVAAVVAQLVRSVGSAIDAGRDVTTIVANFFSFFTVLSNSAAAIVLAWAAVWYALRGRRATVEPPALAVALACTTTYMVITGIVYNLLLRNIDLEPGNVVGWSNEALHLIGPLFLLADLFVGPLRRALPWRALWAVIVFPVVWVVYTLLRAPLITNPGTGDPYWYPYPFLNPNNPGGWGSVAVYVLGIAVAILAVGALVIWWGRRIGATGAAEPGGPAAEREEAQPAQRD